MLEQTTKARVLVAYATNCGSTEEIAQAIGKTLVTSGMATDVRKIEEVTNLERYAAVIIGAPMILGWHRAAIKFLKRHRQALSQIPTALFFTALSLTQTPETVAFPVFVDPELAKPPARAERLSFKERYATQSNYLRPVLRAAPHLKPASIAFFGGKLALYQLDPFQALFVSLIIQATPGDRRNWPAIEAWAARLPEQLFKAQNAI